MQRIFFAFCFLLFTCNFVGAKQVITYPYSIPGTAWEESLGNHRAVVSVKKAATAAHLDFYWRRHDNDVEKRCFLIMNASTGDTVRNVHRIEVNRNHCMLDFGPVDAGTYYFYYLPYTVVKDGGGYSGHYLECEKAPDAAWLSTLNKPQAASVLRVESKTAFDSFYPMEVACSEAEMTEYAQKNKQPFYLFGEDRKFPVKMRRELPLRWLTRKQGEMLKMQAQPNEYYAFQVAVWSPQNDLDSFSYRISDFCGKAATIAAKAVTCFNHEGINPYGKAFMKTLQVRKGDVQPLWFGIDLPHDIAAGTYRAMLTITSSRGDVEQLPLQLTIAGSVIADRGDNETWRYSRLRWLNSRLGLGDTPTEPYGALEVKGDEIKSADRAYVTDSNSPLPAQLRTGDCKLLNAPLRFIVTVNGNDVSLSATPQLKEQTAGHTLTEWKAENADFALTGQAKTEYDGWSDYTYDLLPKRELHVDDVKLQMDFLSESTPYFMGLGLAGQETPKRYVGGWDKMGELTRQTGAAVPTTEQYQWLHPFDSFWIGSADAGVWCEFRGASYTGPLLNLYHPAPPVSWYNEGKGGFKVEQKAEKSTRVTAFSGARILKENEPLRFEFALLLTPVKKLNPERQFTDRYYHRGDIPEASDSDLRAGVRIINVHHANCLNPTINYPFFATDTLSSFIRQWHKRGCKVKIYYTLRELSSVVTELWAIRSLGHEILRGDGGGGYPWLQEHLVNDYVPQWYHHFKDLNEAKGVTVDAAILTAEGDSRWYNYYVEGLRWLVQHDDIDGLYLDDVSFDRRILQRMRRAMESVKPGCLIDLHSNTGFSHGPATQYAEFFPYVDKIWFGESFQYNHMSAANWLVEVSGIPFGLMGDMLQGGGNRWLGMQYGMTVRHPWSSNGKIGDPRFIWKVWDAFDIAHAQMTGYWEKNVPVTTDDPQVKVTVYRHSDGRTLLSLGNYTDSVRTVHLHFDWNALNMNVSESRLSAPEVYSVQPSMTWKPSDAITIKSREGWLIYLESKR